ncbi:MAG: cation diffusion facilitator family transporter [Leadbetterella sp.]
MVLWISHNKKAAIVFSLVISIIVFGLKLWAYFSTHSSAVLTDTAESLVNIVAASFGLYSIYLSSLPLDKNHLYGHGKIEFFSSGLEGLLIVFAGIGTLLPAISNCISGNVHVENIQSGIGINIAIILLNGFAGWLIYTSGKNTNSIILQADGKHLMIDSISSVISMLALILVWITQYALFDPIIAILLAFYIIYSGYKILRESIAGLMDETNTEILENLVSVLNTSRKSEWIDVHNFKIMRYGTSIHVDCHLTLPYYYSLEKSHDLVSEFEKTICTGYKEKIDFFIHSDPCVPQCCSYCKVLECTQRKHEFMSLKEWTSKLLILNQKHFEN